MMPKRTDVKRSLGYWLPGRNPVSCASEGLALSELRLLGEKHIKSRATGPKAGRAHRGKESGVGGFSG